MLTTTNYGLKKPEGNDVVNIDDLNYNADVIDTKLKEINTNLPLKAPLASPAFTGVPTAPTANNGTNNTQVATTAFVNNALSPINTSLSERAIKTYTSLSQLGLTTANTIQDIILAMPNNSKFMLSVGTADATTLGLQMPVDYGIVIIEKVSNARTDIEYIRTNYSFSGNERYACTYANSTNALTTWKKTLNVDDIATKPDFETGIWTPVLKGATTAGSNTYSAQYGWYQRVGKQVHVDCRVQLSALGGMVGQLKIGGLPFTTKAENFRTGVAFGYFNSITIPSGFTIPSGLIGNNANEIGIYYFSSSSQMTAFDASNCTSNTFIVFSADYMID